MPKKKATKKTAKKKEEAPKVVVEEVNDEPKDTKQEQSVETPPIVSDVKVDLEESVDTEVAEDVEKPKMGRLLWIIVPTTLLVGALAGGMITYFAGISKTESVPTPTPKATISPDEPTPTPATEELDREDLSVQVLNGSGKSGVAGKARDFLEELGYTDVAVGNADASDYTETEISILADKEDYLDLLTSDLEDDYVLASESSTLDDSSEYDVVITLGAK